MFSFLGSGMLRKQDYRDNGRVACFDYTQLRQNAARDTTAR